MASRHSHAGAQKLNNSHIEMANPSMSQSAKVFTSQQHVAAELQNKFILLGHKASIIQSKRSFDVVMACLLILIMLPLLVIIVLLIKITSRGEIFFRQNRYGLNGELFEIWKFRTMYVDQGDQLGVKQTKENDVRITPFGQFLRRTSLDELPQMINVIRGEMSLIGPRPHVPGMLAGGILFEELVPVYHQRHLVRPGITGLAQVSGFRGATDNPVRARARIEHDLRYIEHWSLWLDIRILAVTVWREATKGTGI